MNATRLGFLLGLAAACYHCGQTPAQVPQSTATAAVVPPAPPPATAAEPNALPTPPGPWTWMPIAGSACGNGSGTGMGVSIAPDSNRLMIFLQGGGRCDSAVTCGNTNATAVNLQGFSGDDFNSTIATQTGILNRNDPNNPVALFNWVFVPYCTGDDHSGDNVATYGTHHVGYANMGLYLQAILKLFPHVQQVLLTGSSAGGSGAFWNYARTQQAFGHVPVVLLDDAGPFIGNPVVEITATSVAAWGLAKTVPTGCEGCLPGANPNGLQNFYPFFLKTMPQHRGALLTSTQDAHVSQRDNLTGPQFAAALNTLATRLASADPQFKVYYVPSTQHTWLGGVDGSIANVVVNNVPLSTFLQQELDAAPTWSNVVP